MSIWFGVAQNGLKKGEKKKTRGKKEKEKKEGKKEFKEVLKSRDLDNVFEIQVGGKMRIF